MSKPKRGKDRKIGNGGPAEQIPGLKSAPSDNVEAGGALVEEIRDPNAAVAASEGANGDDATIKSIYTAHEFSADSPVMV